MACLIRWLQSSSTDTSHCTATAFMPYLLIKLSVNSHKATYWREAKTRLAPRLANSIANALPIPDDAPVIITTLSFNFIRRRIQFAYVFNVKHRQFKQIFGCEYKHRTIKVFNVIPAKFVNYLAW